MKLHLKEYVLTFILFFGFILSVWAQDSMNQTCSSATFMSLPGIFSGDFFDGGLVTEDNTPVCVEMNQDFPLREVWYEFKTDGVSNYYLYCTGIVGALEFYAGTCTNLNLVACIPTEQGTAYVDFVSSSIQTYYVRLVGYSLPGFSNYVLEYNFVDFTPQCAITIDQVVIYPCVNEDGMIPVTVSGTLTTSEPLLTDVYVEIDTDESYYFTQDVFTGDSWTANIFVSGTQITHVYAVHGSSEIACVATAANFTLPTQTCPESASLSGNFNWTKRCVDRPGKVMMYDPGSDNLRACYDIVVNEDGEFSIDYPILGQFDMLIKIEGYLAKGFEGVTIANSVNNLECGGLIGGDINGDNYVNIADVSLLNLWYGLVLPDEFPALDQSCDGYVNLSDVSLVNMSFGVQGDAAPLGE